MNVQAAFGLKLSENTPQNSILMSNQSLNKILQRIPTEVCDLIFAAYNLCLNEFLKKGLFTKFQTWFFS